MIRKKIKIAAMILSIMFFSQAHIALGIDKITELFMKYNPKQAVEFTQIVREAGEKYKIDPNIIAAIIVRESGVRPTVISKGGDYGLMQVRYKVHCDKVKNANELLEPRINIFIGTQIFAQYFAQKKTLRGALLRYSGGNKTLANRVISTLGKLK